MNSMNNPNLKHKFSLPFACEHQKKALEALSHATCSPHPHTSWCNPFFRMIDFYSTTVWGCENFFLLFKFIRKWNPIFSPSWPEPSKYLINLTIHKKCYTLSVPFITTNSTSLKQWNSMKNPFSWANICTLQQLIRFIRNIVEATFSVRWNGNVCEAWGKF